LVDYHELKPGQFRVDNLSVDGENIDYANTSYDAYAEYQNVEAIHDYTDAELRLIEYYNRDAGSSEGTMSQLLFDDEGHAGWHATGHLSSNVAYADVYFYMYTANHTQRVEIDNGSDHAQNDQFTLTLGEIFQSDSYYNLTREIVWMAGGSAPSDNNTLYINSLESQLRESIVTPNLYYQPRNRSEGVIRVNVEPDNWPPTSETASVSFEYFGVSPIYDDAFVIHRVFDFRTVVMAGYEEASDITLYLRYPDNQRSLILSLTGKPYQFRHPVDGGILEIFAPTCVTVVGSVKDYPASVVIHQPSCCCTRTLPVPFCEWDSPQTLC
jgi:hypothetical protein